MEFAGFCHSCLSNWYWEAAEGKGLPVIKDDSHETIYRMLYDEWKKNIRRKPHLIG
jgi:hypothetical protein